ncbi:uncharacterized protein VP01_38g8 [Puccinia sorghi]|uniref:Uncharacterized protein n=1 Tax=Puccinia sorghi TaxID=27349 RepID=A0A0L6UTJ8_9BASI|nr:uncharacterized protein VP01_38g8 [Puccinia sorghi]
MATSPSSSSRTSRRDREFFSISGSWARPERDKWSRDFLRQADIRGCLWPAEVLRPGVGLVQGTLCSASASGTEYEKDNRPADACLNEIMPHLIVQSYQVAYYFPLVRLKHLSYFDLSSSVYHPRLAQLETKMIKWLARLFIVWVAIIFVASANEEILYGGQQLVEASNEGASATTTGHAVFPSVERESHTANNALNTGKEARLQTECDDDLLTIGLGTRGAYPSYPSSFGQPSRSGVISVLSGKPIHLAKNHEPFQFRSNDNRLSPSGVSLEQVNSQASSSTTRRDFLEQEGSREGTIWNSWGNSLSLKTGVTSDENEAQELPLEHHNRLSAEENCIATPQFIPQEIQPVIRLFQRESNTESHQNAGSSTVQVFPAGRIPGETSSTAGQNGGNVLISLKPPEQRENEQWWRADQGTTSSPRSQPKHSLRAEQNISVDWPKSAEPLLNRSPRPQHNCFQSGNQGSSFENPEHIPQISKISKTHEPETIMAIGNHPSQIDGIKNYGRLKFNADLFEGAGAYQFERSNIMRLLMSIPRPSQGNLLLRDDQLVKIAEALGRRPPVFMSTPLMPQIKLLMGNIDRWYQYWNTHTNIDLETLHHGEKVSRFQFVFPLFFLYVEMIISIIPFKKDLPLQVELDYPQEMRNAIHSYLYFNSLMNTPPEIIQSETLLEKRRSLNNAVKNRNKKPSRIIWKFIDFWMEFNYKALWHNIKEKNGSRSRTSFKSFFNTIFSHGIEIINQNLRYYLPYE